MIVVIRVVIVVTRFLRVRTVLSVGIEGSGVGFSGSGVGIEGSSVGFSGSDVGFILSNCNL